jgi:hypothetical protein
MRIRIQLSTLMRIRIQLLKIVRSMHPNPQLWFSHLNQVIAKDPQVG